MLEERVKRMMDKENYRENGRKKRYIIEEKVEEGEIRVKTYK